MDAKNNKYYKGMAVHVLLLLFTFGIWFLIWNYRMTEALNQDDRLEKRTPINQLLLCMFVPFYSIYWTYRSAQSIDNIAASVNENSDLATICLILAIFVGFVPPIIMQDKVNKLVLLGAIKDPKEGTVNYSQPAPRQIERPRNTDVRTASAAAGRASGVSATVDRVVESLENYTELKGLGIISEAEYEEKKRKQVKFTCANASALAGSDAMGALKKFKELEGRGILSASEFEALKARLITLI